MAAINSALMGMAVGVVYNWIASLWLGNHGDRRTRTFVGALIGMGVGIGVSALLLARGGVLLGALQGVTFGAGMGTWIGGIFGRTKGASLWAGRKRIRRMRAVSLCAMIGPLMGLVIGTILSRGTLFGGLVGTWVGLFVGLLASATIDLVMGLRL